MRLLSDYEARRGYVALGLSVVAGAAGAVLRYWQRLVGFEADTGLPIAGTRPALLLILLSAVVALALLLLVRERFQPAPYERLFAAQGDAYLFGAVAGGMLLLASGVMTALAAFRAITPAYLPEGISALARLTARLGALQLPRLVLAVLSLAGAVCVILGARRCRRDILANKRGAVLLIPAFFACLWLVLAYEAHAADPVVSGYLCELLAVICVLLALYHIAGCAFERVRPARALWFCLLGVYFSIVTLADGHSAPALLRFAFAIVYLLSTAALIVRNRAVWAWQFEPPEDEEEDAEESPATPTDAAGESPDTPEDAAEEFPKSTPAAPDDAPDTGDSL